MKALLSKPDTTDTFTLYTDIIHLANCHIIGKAYKFRALGAQFAVTSHNNAEAQAGIRGDDADKNRDISYTNSACPNPHAAAHD